jgi:large subunit ribosomal protein L3
MIKELYGKKIGMTQIFNDKAELVPVTAIKVGPCVALEEKAYSNKKVVRIGYDQSVKEKNQLKPLAGYFKKVGTPYCRETKEVEKLSDESIAAGTTFDASVFAENEVVDVIGTTIGRGFQGVVKRHGWAGQPAAHGHMMHRRPGGIGCRARPGEVNKGKPMSGHMGDVRATTKNLKVIKIDAANNIIFVKGSCAGHKHATVIIRKTGAK